MTAWQSKAHTGEDPDRRAEKGVEGAVCTANARAATGTASLEGGKS